MCLIPRIDSSGNHEWRSVADNYLTMVPSEMGSLSSIAGYDVSGNYLDCEYIALYTSATCENQRSL